MACCIIFVTLHVQNSTWIPRTGMGEWITKNLCKCSFDADLSDTLRDFAPSTMTLGLYEEADFAFCVVFLACLCISNLKYTPYLQIWYFPAQPNWKFRNLSNRMKSCTELISYCWTSVSRSASISYPAVCPISYRNFNLDIFVDLGLSRRGAHALLRLHLGLSAKQIRLALLSNRKLGLFCSVNPCIQIWQSVAGQWDAGGKSRIYLQGFYSLVFIRLRKRIKFIDDDLGGQSFGWGFNLTTIITFEFYPIGIYCIIL